MKKFEACKRCEINECQIKDLPKCIHKEELKKEMKETILKNMENKKWKI